MNKPSYSPPDRWDRLAVGCLIGAIGLGSILLICEIAWWAWQIFKMTL